MMAKLLSIVFVLSITLTLVLAGRPGSRGSYPRPNRGFKTSSLGTARGFGKRSGDEAMPRDIIYGAPARPFYSPQPRDDLQGKEELANIIIQKLMDLDFTNEFPLSEERNRKPSSNA